MCLLVYYFWVILSLLLHLLYIVNRVLVSVIAWPSQKVMHDFVCMINRKVRSAFSATAVLLFIFDEVMML